MKWEYLLLCGITFIFLFARQVESLDICNNRMLSTNKNNGTITVSSILLDPNVIATPDKAVLNTKEQNLGQGHFEAGGWVSGVQDTKQYLQIQLTTPSVIRGVVTQGRNGCCQQWVSQYRVSYSQDCKTWTDIQKTFTGNTDQDTAVENLFPCPISAKCIRITPLKWNDKISMRVDVLGCPIIPISTLHLTTKPVALSTPQAYHTLGATNISSTIAMTQTSTGLKSSVYTTSAPTTSASASLTSGPSSSNGCIDTYGIDCKLLQTQVKICNNPIASSKYCQKYCGLCGPTISMLMSTATLTASSTSSQLPSSPTIPSTLTASIITNSHFSSTTDVPQLTSDAKSTLSTFDQSSNTISSTDQALTQQVSSMPTSVNSIFHLSTVQDGTSSTITNGQTSSQQCKNNPSIDCNVLNTTISICSNFLTAQLYCPNFCNVCGISTSTQSPGPSTLTYQSDHSTTTSLNPTTMNVCQDRKGVDCSLLQKFYKVCQDKASAGTYCPNYCGLCVSATFASQTTSVKKSSSYVNRNSPSISVSANTPGFSNSTTQNTVTSLKSTGTDSTTLISASTTFSSIPKTQNSTTLKTSPFISGSIFFGSNLTSSLAPSTGAMQTKTSCIDKNGVDCKMLDTYLNLCTDSKAALMYCPLYCGLCGASTAYMASSGHSNIASHISTYTSTVTKQALISSTWAHTYGYMTTDQTTQPTSIKASKFATLDTTSTANYPFTTATLSSARSLMTTTINTCKNAQGVDCSVLNKYWNVCGNRAAALASCPLFCGLCSSSTQANMLQTSPVITTTPLHSTRRNPTNGTQTLLNTTLPLPTTVLSSSTGSDTTSTMQPITRSSSQAPQADTFSSNQMTQFSTGKTCKDKPGIDCHQLDVYLGVCSDLKSAQLYCPLYCGVCGSTAPYQSRHSSLTTRSSAIQTSLNNLSVAQSTFTMLQPTITRTTSSPSGSSQKAYTTKSPSNTSTNGVKTTVPATGYKSQLSTTVPSVYSTKSMQNQANDKSSFSSMISPPTTFPSSKSNSNSMASTTAVSELPTANGSFGSLVTASCFDKSGVDCKQLDKYLNICLDPVISNAYCRKYCGLCTQMTITKTRGISTTAGQSTTAWTNSIASYSNQHSSYKSPLLSTTLSSNANTKTISIGKTTFNINPVSLFSNKRTNMVSNSTPPALSLGLSTSNVVTNVSSHRAHSSYIPIHTSKKQFTNTLLITTGFQASSKQMNYTSTTSKPFSGHITNSTSTGATSGQLSNSYSAGHNLSFGQPLSGFLTSISPGSTFGQTNYNNSPSSHSLTSGQTSTTSPTTGSSSTSGQTFSNTLISHSPPLLSGHTISSDSSNGPTSTSPETTLRSQKPILTSGQTFSSSLPSHFQDMTSGQSRYISSTTGSTSTSGQTFSNSFPSQSQDITSKQTSSTSSPPDSTATSSQTFSNTFTSHSTGLQMISRDTSTGPTSTSVQTNSNTLTSQSPTFISGLNISNTLASQSQDTTPEQTSSISSFSGFTPTSGQTFSNSLPPQSQDITSEKTSSTSTSPGTTATSGKTLSNTLIYNSTSLLTGQTIPSYSSTWSTSTLDQTNSNTFTSQTPTMISDQTFQSSMPSQSKDLTSGKTGLIYSSSGSSFTSGQTSLISFQSQYITSGQTSSTSFTTDSIATSGQTFSNILSFQAHDKSSGQTSSTPTIGVTSTSSQAVHNSQTFSNALISHTSGLLSGQTSDSSTGLTSKSTPSAGHQRYSYSSSGTTSMSGQTFSRSFTPKSPNNATGRTTTLVVTTTTNNPGQTLPNSSPFLTRTTSQISIISSIKPTSPSVSLSSTKQVAESTTNAQVYSLPGKSGPTSPVQISRASLSQTSNTKHDSYYTGTQTSAPVSSGASSSTVSPVQNSTVASSSNSPETSIAATYKPTTPDPCNDTLDCPLVDKFWGVCQDIATALGCLSYCGFCPSGIPITQHLAANITSQSPGISNGSSLGMSPTVTATRSTFSMTPLNSSLLSTLATASAQQNVTNLNISSQINTAITAQSAGTSTQAISPITNGHIGAQGGTSLSSRTSPLSTLSSSSNYSVLQTSTPTITWNTNASKQTTRTQPFISGQSITSSSGSMVSATTTVIKSPLSSTTLLTTTHDPCNDTLDCQLVDKFWGICGNITTAKGCLSYCGFCPSGIPINQGSTTNLNSTLLPVSNSQFALSTNSSSSGTPILSSSTTLSPIASTSSPLVTVPSTGISISSTGSTPFRSSRGTAPNGLTETTTSSCRDSPTVDCALIDKFWHVCSDIQTAQSCLRHCGFCP